MSKIGTAHIEIKPIVNDEALAIVMQRIEDAVAEAVERGIAKASGTVTTGPFTTTHQ